MRQSRPVSLTESGDAKIKVEYGACSRACSMYSKVVEKAEGAQIGKKFSTSPVVKHVV